MAAPKVLCRGGSPPTLYGACTQTQPIPAGRTSNLSHTAKRHVCCLLMKQHVHKTQILFLQECVFLQYTQYCLSKGKSNQCEIRGIYRTPTMFCARASVLCGTNAVCPEWLPSTFHCILRDLVRHIIQVVHMLKQSLDTSGSTLRMVMICDRTHTQSDLKGFDALGNVCVCVQDCTTGRNSMTKPGRCQRLQQLPGSLFSGLGRVYRVVLGLVWG